MEVYKLLPHSDFGPVSGPEVRWLMRSRRVTIRRLATAANITMARVREIRKNGTEAGLRAWEVYRMVEIAAHH